MSDTNRLQISYVEEITQGTTPAISGTTVMRQGRVTGESLNANTTNIVSNEIRTDRMVPDLIQSGQQNSGAINFELSYPLQRSFIDQMMGGALYNAWTNLPYKNNIVADTEIANVGSGTGVYTVDANGTTFLAGHMVKASGFTNAANNGVFPVTASGATTVTMTNASSVTEAAPPIGATLQVVGIVGAASDITATASGLACTAAGFVAAGITVGKWIKVGGTASGDKFATTALNTFIRVTAVTATTITADNLPAGWGVDAGTGKTIKLWFGDTLKNGTTQRFFTIEKGFSDVSQYLVFKGEVPATMNLSLNAQQIITGSFDFMGMTATASGSSLGTPVAATTEDVLSAMSNVGRVAENGSALGPTNYVQAMTVQVQNNPRPQAAIGQVGLIGIGSGRNDVTGSINTYFSDRTLYDKYIAGTETSLNFRTITTGGRALIVTAPKVEFETGTVNAGQGNADLFANFTWRSKYDSVTNSQLMIDRFPYYEA